MSERQYNHIAETLKKFRLQAGFSQKNVADILNINRSTYSYYEIGKTTPDVRTLIKIAKIFGIPTEIFLEDDNTEPVFSDSSRRPGKIVYDNPTKVGELSSKEKTLIALLRTENPQALDELIIKLHKANRKKF